jgi:hypothetical protein
VRARLHIIGLYARRALTAEFSTTTTDVNPFSTQSGVTSHSADADGTIGWPRLATNPFSLYAELQRALAIEFLVLPLQFGSPTGFHGE